MNPSDGQHSSSNVQYDTDGSTLQQSSNLQWINISPDNWLIFIYHVKTLNLLWLTESTDLIKAGKIKKVNERKWFNQIFADVTGCSGNINVLAVVILGRKWHYKLCFWILSAGSLQTEWEHFLTFHCWDLLLSSDQAERFGCLVLEQCPC